MYKKAAVSFCHDFKENLASPLISCQIPNMFHEDLNTLFAHIKPPSNIFLKQFTSSTTLMFSMQNLNHIPFCLLSNQITSATFTNKLIIESPDKNSGMFDLQCPLVGWYTMKELFWDNPQFERKKLMSPECLLLHFRYIYQESN